MIKPLHIELINDPMFEIDTIHEISAADNGPLANGVSFDTNIGINCVGQPVIKPFANISKLAVKRERKKKIIYHFFWGNKRKYLL